MQVARLGVPKSVNKSVVGSMAVCAERLLVELDPCTKTRPTSNRGRRAAGEERPRKSMDLRIHLQSLVRRRSSAESFSPTCSKIPVVMRVVVRREKSQGIYS
jgi:hypothetical protein